jgi:hypothetical protein
MASLCSHVRIDHKVAEAEVKVQKFPNYQEVEVVFLLMIIVEYSSFDTTLNCILVGPFFLICLLFVARVRVYLSRICFGIWNFWMFIE